jgi:hypothetical protein
VFDLHDETLTRVKKDTPIDRLPKAEAGDNTSRDIGEEERLRELHRKLISYYRTELERQSDNRLQQAIDEDYYDHIQWSADEAQVLRERGQAPMVYNVIAQSVNWIIGSEKRGRTDFKILPRGKEDAKPAEGKTKYMKYLSDVNRTPFHRSRAFEDAVKVGIGWLEIGVQDEDDGEPIYFRYESWRNMLWDSASTELDGSDSRYQFRSKWVDEDVALAMFPSMAAQIAEAVTDSTLFGLARHDGDEAMDRPEYALESNGISGALITAKRRRLRLIECWYRTPEKVKKLRGHKSAFNGQVYDANDPRHVASVQSGECTVVSKMMMRTRIAIMTTGDVLWEGPSPYRHNRFKFVPVWGFKRGRDGLPYGVIRGMRDIQDGVNKRASKALHILSTNKVIMDEGAVEDMDAFAEEVARPDAIIVRKAGKNIDLNVDRELAAPHIEMMSRDIQMIQQVGGVTDELLGRTTNAVSGIAVEKRQEQGSLATSKFFDNLRLAVQMHGEIELSLIEQYVTDEKSFRITNQRGTPEFISVNDGLPENDIARTKADFVISEAEWRATMRQAAVDQLTEMLVKMPPQVAIVILDLLVESMDIPNRDEIVKRIRAINGMRDPDATEVTPEEAAQEQQKAEAAALQARAALAEVGLKEAQAKKAEAEAGRTSALKTKDAMDAALAGMQAATAVVSMPTIAKVADNLLLEGGWADNRQSGTPAPIQGMPPMPQQAPQQAAPAPQQAVPDGMAPNEAQ